MGICHNAQMLCPVLIYLLPEIQSISKEVAFCNASINFDVKTCADNAQNDRFIYVRDGAFCTRYASVSEDSP